jgi:hypothetical protein
MTMFQELCPQNNVNYTGMWAPTVPNSVDEFQAAWTRTAQDYDGCLSTSTRRSPESQAENAARPASRLECVAQGRDYSDQYLIGDQAIAGPLQSLSIGFNSVIIGQ